MKNDTLPAHLCAFHRLRNGQIGLDADTVFVRGLYEYATTVLFEHRQEKHKQMMILWRAAFLNGVIAESRNRADELVGSATTPQQKRDILPDVAKWLNLAKKSQVELEGLQNG